jgi:PAS domain S-box-containing protein
MDINQNRFWRLLWEYDPNGLIVVDTDMNIKFANPAFCKMFKVTLNDVIHQPAVAILEDVSDFKEVWEQDIVIRDKVQEYPLHSLYVEQVIFSIQEEEIIASIMVDITHEIERKNEMDKLKNDTIKKVNEVVDKQMKVVQEIAGLLGETTAETKVGLLKIIQTLETGNNY